MCVCVYVCVRLLKILVFVSHFAAKSLNPRLYEMRSISRCKHSKSMRIFIITENLEVKYSGYNGFVEAS